LRRPGDPGLHSVTGEDLPATAAMDLAERSLSEAEIFGAR
jgi:hypothetical protein